MSRSFRLLMAALLLVLALGVCLLVLGLRTSPFTLPFSSSI